MEIILGIFAFILVITVISIVMETINNWLGSINWVGFFSVLLLGGVLLAIIFSFTSEGVLVILGAYVILITFSLIFGKFRKLFFLAET